MSSDRRTRPPDRGAPLTGARWLCAAALPFLTAACSLDTSSTTTTTLPPSTQVVLVGDSLAEQAAQYLPALLPGREFVGRYFGGTAPCDWLENDLQPAATATVVLSFTGNSMTPCMADGAGGYLAGQAMVQRYHDDLVLLIDRAHGAGARVLLVGQPTRPDDAGRTAVDALNTMLLALSSERSAQFVDAGAAVERPDGSFATTLPCLPDEPECPASGEIAVRNDDGLHFCPGSMGAGPCATYSSGAFRFAATIAAVIT
ncbi:MAG: hypothetical protein Q7V57_00195 [Actinomycetota bacterium]|nr:hypothetical protein [Actinomycetota bacterium]